MSRGKPLNDIEKGRILAYKEIGMSNRRIAEKLGRSSGLIDNFVKNPKNYGKKKSSGRPKIIAEREKRLILKTASNSVQSSREIMKELNVQASLRTVQRVLSSSDHLKYQKIQIKPPLTEAHKAARLGFCNKYLTWTNDWRKVIFSDEKKFNLDGPDSWKYYWHDLRKEEKVLSKRQHCGGSVMIWAAIGYKKKSDLAFIDTTMNSEGYTNMLSKQFPRFGRIMAGNGWIFQQDNAACHTSRHSMQWFSDKKMRILEWPARSPDLNIIENLWGILARTVYAGCRQFNTKNELKDAIMTAWEEIPQETVHNLFEDMHTRMKLLLKADGGSIPR